MFDKIFSNDDKKSEDTSRVIIKKIEDIPPYYADKINDTILKEEFYKIALFLGGEFIIEYVDEKNYTCTYTLYFQNKKDDAYKITAATQPMDMTRLSAEVKKDLETQKNIKFEISEPSEEVRQKYTLSVD